MKTTVQLLATSVFTHPSLSDPAKAEICSLLLAEKAITPRVIFLLKLYGVESFLNLDPEPLELYKLPAGRVFSYLPTATEVHMKIMFYSKGDYINLSIGEHECSERCVIITPEKALKVLEKATTGVEILLHRYLLESIAVYSDNSVRAIASSSNRQFLLRGAGN